jgi:hypothetical protein
MLINAAKSQGYKCIAYMSQEASRMGQDRQQSLLVSQSIDDYTLSLVYRVFEEGLVESSTSVVICVVAKMATLELAASKTRLGFIVPTLMICRCKIITMRHPLGISWSLGHECMAL